MSKLNALENLKKLKVSQLLASDKFNITVEVVEINLSDRRFPVRVMFVKGDKNVACTKYDGSEFSWRSLQWLAIDNMIPAARDSKREFLTLKDLYIKS